MITSWINAVRHERRHCTRCLGRTLRTDHQVRHERCQLRHFAASTRRSRPTPHRKESFSSRLRIAWGNTRVQWRPIPVGLGIGFLGGVQVYRLQQRQYAKEREEARLAEKEEEEAAWREGRPPRRQRIRPSGPWYDCNNREKQFRAKWRSNRQVQIMSTLPLKAISRIWGRFNELEIPYYLRVPGFRLYSWIFGVKYVPVFQ